MRSTKPYDPNGRLVATEVIVGRLAHAPHAAELVRLYRDSGGLYPKLFHAMTPEETSSYFGDDHVTLLLRLEERIIGAV